MIRNPFARSPTVEDRNKTKDEGPASTPSLSAGALLSGRGGGTIVRFEQAEVSADADGDTLTLDIHSQPQFVPASSDMGGTTSSTVAVAQEESNRAITEDRDPPLGSADTTDAAANATISNHPENSDPPSSDVEGIGQGIFLDAKVEVVAPSPSTSPLPPPSLPPSLYLRESSEGLTLCGVPVAQLLLPDKDGQAEGSGDSSETFVEDGEVLIAQSSRSGSFVRPHLRYMGQVTMATMDEDVEQGGQAGGEDGSSSDRQEPSDNVPQTTSPISGEILSSKNNFDEHVSRWRKGNILGGVVLAILLVSGAVGIMLGTQRQKADDGIQDNKTVGKTPSDENTDLSGSQEPMVSRVSPEPSPTLLPVALPYHDNLITQLLNPFLQSTGSNAHRVKGTPQHQALEWLYNTSFGVYDHFDLSDWIGTRGEETAVSLLPPEQEERLKQRYVLAVLYYSTMGQLTVEEQESSPGWLDNANFLSENHECEWSSSERAERRGVTCDNDMRVVEINLKNNNLSGQLPPKELHGLTRLRKIDLSQNSNIEGPLPEDLGHLFNLTILLLEQNALTGTIPSSYGNLTQLTAFKLDNNELTGSIPSEVSRMTSLTNIRMDHNKFTEGMNNFCHEYRPDDIGKLTFWADCFCKNFPVVKAEVKCTCCTICCDDVGCQPILPDDSCV